MLLEMLEYMRPEGSDTQKEFCSRYLKPIMGDPDQWGNYVHIIGDKPNLAFMAHHDTVHNTDGIQHLMVDKLNYVRSTANCLGADCTTGVWLILEMIKAGVEGVYVVHAGEEIGCVGSRALVGSNPEWLSWLSAAISFDRRGTDSIITHQMGQRTASDVFARSLAAALQLDMEPDDGGSYTDSNEYADIVSECTNISVGYFKAHTKDESQDIDFAYQLRAALLSADFSKLVFKRDPSVVEYADTWGVRSWAYSQTRRFYSSMYGNDDADDYRNGPTPLDDLAEVVSENPYRVAYLLQQLGYDAYDVLDILEDDEYSERAIGF